MPTRLLRPRLLWLFAAAVLLCAASLTAKSAPAAVKGGSSKATGETAAAGAYAEAPPPDLRIGDVHFDVKLEAFADTYVGMTHFSTHTVQIDPASQDEQR